jgi:hypothetical protein
MLSMVHLLERNQLMAKRYSQTQSKRNDTWKQNIQELQEGKYIAAEKSEIDYLVSTIALIARFWISEAAVSYRHMSTEQQMRHYIRMIARIFLPYTTAKGKRYLNTLL